MIVQEQTPKRVMDVRGKLYELLSHCIPPHVVLKVRTFKLLSPEADVLPVTGPIGVPVPKLMS